MPDPAASGLAREFGLRQAALSSARVDPEREPVVLVTRFGDSAVNLLVVFWSRDYAEQGLARSEVHEAIHDGLAAAGIQIPFPIRHIIEQRAGAPPPRDTGA